MCVCMSVSVYERESVSVRKRGVCMWEGVCVRESASESERERESVCVCVCECVSVFVCVYLINCIPVCSPLPYLYIIHWISFSVNLIFFSNDSDKLERKIKQCFEWQNKYKVINFRLPKYP